MFAIDQKIDGCIANINNMMGMFGLSSVSPLNLTSNDLSGVLMSNLQGNQGTPGGSTISIAGQDLWSMMTSLFSEFLPQSASGGATELTNTDRNQSIIQSLQTTAANLDPNSPEYQQIQNRIKTLESISPQSNAFTAQPSSDTQQAKNSLSSIVQQLQVQASNLDPSSPEYQQIESRITAIGRINSTLVA
jgi:hypothetical protein